MFSVSAEPFNSPRRQLYGGWTLQDAGNNIWAVKQFHEMARKYSADEAERKAAGQFLTWWRKASKADPTLRKRLRAAGKDYWKDAISPPLTAAQKKWIWDNFKSSVPFTKDAVAQRKSAFFRHAPYPSYPTMNAYEMMGVPFVAQNPMAAGGDWDVNQPFMPQMGWRTTAELEEAFKNMRRGYGEPSDEWLAQINAYLPALVKKEEPRG